MSENKPYDLHLIHNLCTEIGYSSIFVTSDELLIYLKDDVILRFLNNVITEQANNHIISNDSLIDLGADFPWHTHGHEFEFYDPKGQYIAIGYLDIISGLALGEILISELWKNNKIADRWLIHKDYNDEFDIMGDEEIRIRRVSPSENYSKETKT